MKAKLTPCKDHGLPYIAFHEDADRRHKRGERQLYCGLCGKWFWPDHVSDDHRPYTTTSRRFWADARKMERRLAKEQAQINKIRTHL